MSDAQNQVVETTTTEVSEERKMPTGALQATLSGDWKNVSQRDRLLFIKYRCEELGIPLALNPFRFMNLKGKETLYTTADAAFSIARVNKMSCTIEQESFDENTRMIKVIASVKDRHGMETHDIGMLHVPSNVKGQDLANAMMKCVTKAKRRAILSACGLTSLDDEEVQSIKTAPVKEEKPSAYEKLVDAPKAVVVESQVLPEKEQPENQSQEMPEQGELQVGTQYREVEKHDLPF